MASILDMSASSDSEDDVDYVPTNVAVTDSSCDEVSDEEDFKNSGHLNGKTTKKRQQAPDGKDPESDSTPKVVDEKKRAKDLWASFLNDVESVTPKKFNPAECILDISTEIPGKSETKERVVPEIDTKKAVSKVFEFAGETITVDNDLNSCDFSAVEKNTLPVTTAKPFGMLKKRGIDSVLGTLMNKNKKLTILEKTKIDWVGFKKDENLDNDLEKFNKGKQGFIERKRFLERSDIRSFEMEKSMRQTLRKK